MNNFFITRLFFRFVFVDVNFMAGVRLTGYDYNNLSPRRVLGEVINYFGEGAAYGGFVYFGYFAGDLGRAVGAACLGELLEGFDQPQGRFVDDEGAVVVGKGRYARGAAFFLREESLEYETVAGKA